MVATGFLDFFFFQAEDGIRDVAVTGVQTCALPICFFRRLFSNARPRFLVVHRISFAFYLTPAMSFAQKEVQPGLITLSSPTRSPIHIFAPRSEEHTSELQSRLHLVCRLLLENNRARSDYLDT